MNERAPIDPEVLGGLPGPESPKGMELSEGKRMNKEVAEAIVQSRVKRGERIGDIIQGLEEEMDGMEEKMKGKKGTQEWDDYALMLNDKERQLQVAERISERDKRQSGETMFQTQHAQAAADAKKAKERAEAFAWAKSRAEEVRASYAKPATPKPASTGFFSRITGWFASLSKQREAGKKIAEALTPALRGEPTPEEAQRNAKAYEERVFSKSRFQQTKDKEGQSEEIAAK